jgi:hypothetical protein
MLLVGGFISAHPHTRNPRFYKSSSPELHDHCDANCLGCQEELVDELGLEKALPILNAAQEEVNLWLVANSIEYHPHFCSIDMNVESHSEAFNVKHGRYPDIEEDGEACAELFFDPIYLKIRAWVRERTGK